MEKLKRAAEKPKFNMYNNTFDGVSDYIKNAMYPIQLQLDKDEEAEAESPSNLDSCLNDVIAQYPFWLTNTNDIENTDEACNVENRQAIAQALQKDTPVKTYDNRTLIDNVDRYTHDRQAISFLLNKKLGLGQFSLPGAQQVTVATVQHTHLLTGFPNHIPHLSLGLGQDIDSDDRDYDGEELYQVDHPTDIRTPDNSDQSEDSDSEVVITSKDKRNINNGPNMKRKQMTHLS